MPTVLEELKELHSSCNPYCVVTSCRKGRCKIILDILEKIVCIDCDLCGTFASEREDNEKRPDFVILYNNSAVSISRWFVIEMKGRVSHPRRIVKQLQEGANIIAGNEKFGISEYRGMLNAFVVRDKHVRATDFAQRYVSFRGKRSRVVVVKSPSKLSSLVN